jgi:hypothetical protein
MAGKAQTKISTDAAPVCGVGKEGLKCAVVSWLAPLIAIGVLVAGLYYPAVRALNIIFLAFGLTALARSVAHIRAYGGCGLGGHVAVGVVLNVAIVVLVAIYVFTGLDPLKLRP